MQWEPRRANRLRGALVVTALGAVLPGAGLAWTRRRVGWVIVAATLVGVAGLAVYLADRRHAVSLLVSPQQLRAAAWLIALVVVTWVGSILATYVLARPDRLTARGNVIGVAATLCLCAAVTAPFVVAGRYATTQADLVTHVFEDNTSATVPTDVTVEDPWGGRDRVNVLLLGGDAQGARSGLRTDTVILVSVNTRTGRTVMFSLPRNMMNAPFPAYSPLHQLYPSGFRGDGDPGFWMLNAIYGQVPLLHPGILGDSDNEGADAVKQAVSGALGLTVDYYVLVNLDGFKEIVDAIGGVTVNINKPIAIQGNTDAGIPPVGYLEPGPDQHLDGYHALWYSRGRWGSDDYERMLRQRCMVDAIIEEAKPLNLLRRYEALAAAGRDIVRTDIPRELLPAFVDLALLVKHADVRSVAFVSSSAFYPGDPDYAWVQQKVTKALEPVRPKRARAGGGKGVDVGGRSGGSGADADPGDAVVVKDSCAYDPVS